MGVRTAGLALLGSGVPEVRGNAGNAYILFVQERFVGRAAALPVGFVEDEAWSAVKAFLGVGVPHSRV